MLGHALVIEFLAHGIGRIEQYVDEDQLFFDELIGVLLLVSELIDFVDELFDGCNDRLFAELFKRCSSS